MRGGGWSWDPRSCIAPRTRTRETCLPVPRPSPRTPSARRDRANSPARAPVEEAVVGDVASAVAVVDATHLALHQSVYPGWRPSPRRYRHSCPMTLTLLAATKLETTRLIPCESIEKFVGSRFTANVHNSTPWRLQHVPNVRRSPVSWGFTDTKSSLTHSFTPHSGAALPVAIWAKTTNQEVI